MKRIVKIGAGLFAVVLLGVGAVAARVQFGGTPYYPTQPVALKVEVTPERVARGRHWANMLCAGCHLDVKSGRLTGADMHGAEFGKIYSLNITQHPTAGIGAWTDGELAFLLRTGIARDGRYTPPWMTKVPHMSDEDLESIIAFLRSDDPLVAASEVPNVPSEPSFLAKFLIAIVLKPYPFPTHPIEAPAPTDLVATGRYLTWNLDCYSCHSADFSKADPLEPPKTAGFMGGGNLVEGVMSANLTPDPTAGIGRWSEEDFVRALREGVRPDHTAIRYPMNAYSELTLEQARAIFAYLKTVPPLPQVVARTPAPVITAQMDAGKQVYVKYACTSCHAEGGMGNCDLTHNRARFPTDEALTAFIREPTAVVPGSRMPTWKNVIADAEMKDLVAHVRSLDRSPPGAQEP